MQSYSRYILASLDELEGRRLSPGEARTLAMIDQGGVPHLDYVPGPSSRAEVSAEDARASIVLPLVLPYRGRGPDLLVPRPHLRIVPGKLHGEPHVVDTRIPSATLHALHRAGYPPDQISEMFPEAAGEPLAEALDLEASLDGVAA